jgi:prephenate dehydratase
MSVFYQGEPGAYSHMVASWAAEILGLNDSDVAGLETFSDVWKSVERGNVGIFPVENSYAGSIHENLYGFLRYPFVVRAEYLLPVDHCLLSHETELSKIVRAYSHPQALAQCHDFLKAHGISPVIHADTAGAAKALAVSNEPGAASISSKKAAGIYALNVLAEGIQDQKGNTTRFFIITRDDIANDTAKRFATVGKTSLIFEAKNVPASLYHCLGAFANHGVNLTKIESLPSLGDPFSYAFWIDLEGTPENAETRKALEELERFAKTVRIVGSY